MSTTEHTNVEAPELRRGQLRTLTGMRFVAAALVFLCHFSIEGFVADKKVNGVLQLVFIRGSWGAVEFFFILSGFVLTWSAKPNDTVRAFWRRRAVKLYPNNLVVCLIVIVITVAVGGALAAGQVVPNLLLVQAWFLKPMIFTGLNPPTWSLSCEVLFYALFPLLLRGVNRIPRRWLWGAAAAIVALVVLIPVVTSGMHVAMGNLTGPISYPRLWLIDRLPVMRVADFVLGIVLARIVMTRQWPRIGLVPAILFALACFGLTLVVPVAYALTATMMIGLAAVVAAGAVTDVRDTRSVFRGRTMVWLGEVSFAFYVVHMLLLSYGHKLLGEHRYGLPAAIAVGVGFFVLATGVAALLHTFVERPAMRRFSRSRNDTVRPAAVRVPQPASDPNGVR